MFLFDLILYVPSTTKIILPRVPYRGAVFKLRANICVVSCFFNFLIICLYVFILINFKVLYALVVIFSMWGFQLKSLLMVIPRYLAFSVDFSSVLRSLYGKMSGVFCLDK